MYKAIIFDFFDVIHRDPYNHWLRQNGLKRSGKLEETATLFDLGAISLEEHHRRASDISGKPVEGIRASFDDISFIDEEMVGLIKKLKQACKTGLLSNSGMEYIGRIMDKYDIESLFDVITVSAEVGLAKPDRKIFEHVLDELGVDAKEAIFIDDNPKNVEAAAALGIRSIVYKDIDTLKQELAKSDIEV